MTKKNHLRLVVNDSTEEAIDDAYEEEEFELFYPIVAIRCMVDARNLHEARALLEEQAREDGYEVVRHPSLSFL